MIDEPNEFKAVSESVVRVRYQETDQMGRVYHGNYFTWFEVGRTDFFRSMGLPYTFFENRGIWLPVVEADCKYKGFARYDDLVTIRTVLTGISPAKIKFAYRAIVDNETTVALGVTSHAFVNRTGRAVNLAKTDPELWQKIMEALV